MNTSSVLAQGPVFYDWGAFDIFDDETTAEFRLGAGPERQKIGIFTPFIGFSGTANSEVMFTVDRNDLFFGNNFVVTPFWGRAYGNGDGKDLGNPLEFRSGITFSADYQTIETGTTFHHISNAGLNERNPVKNQF